MAENESYPHESVMVKEIIALLPVTIRIFIDGTVGAGGHAEGILSQHPEIEQYIAFDQDVQALAIAQTRLAPWREKMTFLHDSFFHLPSLHQQGKIPSPDAMLFDLGVSSMQLDIPERGFTFREEGPLDMRMDQSQSLTAEEIVNEWPERKLGEIFLSFGEEHRWRKAAKALVEARRKERIRTTEQLIRALAPAIGKGGRIHPATRIFQALRIAVNGELQGLQESLPEILPLLSPAGRCLVISFHSLEDRIVKYAFREISGKGGDFTLLTKKPLIPSREEQRKNRRSRSAKLRAIARNNDS